MSDVAIRVEGLGKRYRIGAQQQRHDTLRDAIVDGVSRLKVGRSKVDNLQPSTLQPSTLQSSGRDTDFWALKDVSFEVKTGEVVGVIGRNGAGKSTLLKILSRITEPTEGRAEIHGRVGSLLEVGTGFHPELSGRENIFLNGAILGMRRTEIAAKFDEIVAFSEIEKFLDTPVKRYSSGMYVRLAFAVAAHLEPEILLVDEVLAVGDAQFQKKCLGKMGDVAKEGRTVMFVSHSMAAIESLCVRGYLIRHGQLAYQGGVRQCVAAYLSEQPPSIKTQDGSIVEDLSTGVTLLTLDVLDNEGHSSPAARAGDDLVLALTIKTDRTIPHVAVTIGLNNLYGTRVTVLHSEIAGYDLQLEQGLNRAYCRIPRLPVAPGKYGLDVKIIAGFESLLWGPGIGPLEVESGDFFGSGKLPDPAWSGGCLLSQQWEIAPLQSPTQA